jgi:glycosyltransferase involved in cell wall biosynthesis
LKNSVKISENLSSRILTVGPDYLNHRGGVGAVIAVYSRYFDKFNFIVTQRNGSALSKILLFLISFIKLIRLLISDRKVKIIHIHGASYGSFYRKFVVFFVGRYLFGKKIIYHIHGGGFKVFYENSNPLSKRLIETMVNRADVVITLSESWNEYFKTTFSIKRLIIIPNIIDYPVVNENRPSKDILNLLFLGLITDGKGIFDLINVIAGNKDKYHSKIHLSVGGNGEVNRLNDLIKKHNIEELVEFLGWITREQKEIALSNTDIYILPSYNEGLPVSILESMSYGKAIISTDVGGIPEIVRNRENGLLISPGDLKQIEDALDFFLEYPQLIKEYGAVSELMVQKYLPHSVLKELTEIYKSLISNE